MPRDCTKCFGENCDLTVVQNFSLYIYGDQKKAVEFVF